MTKRTFLKTSASLIAGSATAQNPRKNWAGNYAYKAAALRMPKTLDEVRNAGERLIKVVVINPP